LAAKPLVPDVEFLDRMKLDFPIAQNSASSGQFVPVAQTMDGQPQMNSTRGIDYDQIRMFDMSLIHHSQRWRNERN
jgi:hypothetical protein